MPVDFRYHITSLIAVFLALLIGLLIGIALVAKPELEQQVEFFDNALDERKQENERLEAEVQVYRTFANDAVWTLTDNVLAGKHVALVYASPRARDAFLEELQLPRVLKHAGAVVTSTTTIQPEFRELERAQAVPVFEEFGWPVPIDGDLRRVLAAKLGAHIAEGRPALPARLKEPPLKVIGIGVEGDYTQPADCVVMVAGLDREDDEASVGEVDLPMISGLQETGHRVVACQPHEVPIKTIARYRSSLIPTVEAADMPYGRLALVLAIDRARGNFGATESALWPPLEDYLVASLRPAPERTP